MSIENRKFLRRQIDLNVQIDAPDGSRASGKLLDVSRTGVRLELTDCQDPPEYFELTLQNGLRRWVRVVWRSGEQMGGEFVAGQPSVTTPKQQLSVFIMCPVTRRSIPTGIQLMAADDLSKLPKAQRFTHCRYCNIVHGWNLRDASLKATSVRDLR